MTTYTVLPDSTIVYDDAYMNYTKGVKKYNSFWNSRIGRCYLIYKKINFYSIKSTSNMCFRRNLAYNEFIIWHFILFYHLTMNS